LLLQHVLGERVTVLLTQKYTHASKHKWSDLAEPSMLLSPSTSSSTTSSSSSSPEAAAATASTLSGDQVIIAVAQACIQ
jgi:hypothetical protein